MVREWIQNIVVFLLFMFLVRHLIPEESYGKYIRLVMGIILILVLVTPVTKWLNLEDWVNQTFFKSQLQAYASDFEASGQLFESGQRFSESYRKIISEELGAYFEKEGMQVRYCEIEMNDNMEDEQYGEIYSLRVGIMPMEQALLEDSMVSEIEIEKIDIGTQENKQKNKIEGVRNIPEEKVKEWKENISTQFGVKDEALNLEILS